MPLPFSKSQVRKLGERLRAGQYSDDDVAMLQSLLEAYDDVLAASVRMVADFEKRRPAPRIKNTGTIIEKLQRSKGAQLNSIQDLAGMRIVMDNNDRRAQDELVVRLSKLFEDTGCLVKKVDRRTDPRSGYRAVHLIVESDGIPVEIQVRTQLQHEWAEFFEKLADRLGRGIRYGESPNVVNLHLPGDVDATAINKLVDDIVNVAKKIADAIAAFEEALTQDVRVQEHVEDLRQLRDGMPLLIALLDQLSAIGGPGSVRV